jgi:hypothetical protein
MLEFDTTGLPAYRTMNDVQHTEQGPIIGSVCKRVNEAECQVIDSIPLASPGGPYGAIFLSMR